MRRKWKVSFDRQRENVVQLLKDRGDDMTTGPSFKDFEEMGPQQGGQWAFTAEFLKRYFGKPKDRDDPESTWKEHIRGASHAVLERRLEELYRDAPRLHMKVVNVFPRDEGAHSDKLTFEQKAARVKAVAKQARQRADRVVEAHEEKVKALEAGERVSSDAIAYARSERRKAENRASNLEGISRGYQDDLWLCDRGIDILTLYCMEDEMFVEFARARSKEEEQADEYANAAIARDYEDLKAKPGVSEKDAASTVADKSGTSVTTVRRIAESQRLARGEEKQKPGRPRKAG